MALGPFFHELENKGASRTPTGPLFTSREIGKRVMVQWSEIVWEETVSV